MYFVINKKTGTVARRGKAIDLAVLISTYRDMKSILVIQSDSNGDTILDFTGINHLSSMTVLKFLEERL